MTLRDPHDATDDHADDAPPMTTDIAVVGMAGRFPEARDVDTYWQNLVDGKECIRRLTDDELLAAGVAAATLRDPRYVKAAAVYDDVFGFDAGFFGFSPREASILDPQHRHFLEVCYEALEYAGHAPDGFAGRIGVFGGSGMNAYMPYHLFTNKALMRDVGLFLIRHTGNDKDFLTTRVSYCLDLRGPVVNVQTACSTSLVAIHLAVQSLLAGECDMALAGGVTIELPHHQGYFYEEGEILSPDGHCRAFDHRSKGTVFGSAAGVVVLRRLQDAQRDGDTIHAVVKATAINNDGARKVGYLAPSVDGQAECIAEAINLAGLTARDVSYVECHGTGTPVGDPIEVTALTQAFRATTDETGFCRIGSVKTNIGHTDTAAGIASFIKVVMMLREKTIAPTLHFEKPNPSIDFAKTPFSVAHARSPWTVDEGPRRAGVSSLGVGGTNAHVIVEEAPPPAPRKHSVRPRILALSARSEAALDVATSRLAAHLERHDDVSLADVSHTLLRGRRRFAHRRVLAASTPEEAIAILRGHHTQRAVTHRDDHTSPRPVVFMLPGGGAQHPGMFEEVYEHERVFRDVVDECVDILAKSEGLDVRRWLFPRGDDRERAAHMLEGTAIGLPALATVEIAMAELMLSLGVKPVAMIGHSLGENVVAHLAGVVDRASLLSIVACRGRLFEELPEGAMLSLSLAEDDARRYAERHSLDVATVNADGMVVVSGRPESISSLAETLARDDVEHKRLKIRTAAHSAMLDEILPKFRAHVATMRLARPTADYVSNVSGTWMRPEDATSPDAWARHLRSPVRFKDGLTTVLERHKDAVLVEIGPGGALSSFVRQHKSRRAHQVAIPTARHPSEPGSDRAALTLALGRLWASGVEFSLDPLFADDELRRVPLPTYPFEHEHHVIEPGRGFFRDPDDDDTLSKEGDLARWFYTPELMESALPTPPSPSGEVWLVIDDPAAKSASLGDLVAREAAARGATIVRVHAGAACVVDAERATIRLGEVDDVDDVLQGVLARHERLDRVVDLLGVTGVPDDEVTFDTRATTSFDAPFALMRVLGGEGTGKDVRVLVVTDGLLSVHGEPVRDPMKALALGPVKVAPREIPEVSASLLDVPVLGAAPMDDVARAIVDEAASAVSEPVVAWRASRRHVERFVRHPLQEPAAPFALRGAGSVLITGGLGGLGLTIAEALARSGTKDLVLVGRKALPARDTWDRALAERAPRDPLRQRIEAVRRIEATGARVLAVAADVSSRDDMRRVFEDAGRALSPVRAVLHAAGVVDDAPLGLKDLEQAHAVIAPKVEGARVLAELTREVTLDALVFFSSTSAALGPPGQVDYVAANAVLDALAASLATTRAETRVVAVAWGVWRDVGMAASMFDTKPRAPAGVRAPHALLGHVEQHGERSVFTSLVSSRSTFVLDEHRLREGALPVLPGTAYAELARAAFTVARDPTGAFVPVELHELYFTTPLAVPDGTERFLSVDVFPDEGEARVVRVESAPLQGGTLVEHARARVTPLASPPPVVDVERIRARTSSRVVTFEPGAQLLPQESALLFGPAWKCVVEMRFGAGEALARLVRPVDDRARDLALHPGLLDMLSGFAFALLDDEKSAGVIVPMGYDSIRVYAPLPSTLLSHVVVRRPPDASGTAALDVTACDEQGRVVLSATGYLVKRVAPDAFARSAPSDEAPTPSEPSRLARWLEHGITPLEGEDALFRALDDKGTARLLVSSLDLYRLDEELTPKRVKRVERASSSASSDAREDAPRDEIERTLAELWRGLLGVDELGIRDNFFDLGGHSLVAVRLFARIKKLYGVDLSISVLFEAPTIETCAAILRRELGIAFEPSAPSSTVASEHEKDTPAVDERRFSPLVPIEKGNGGTPFFCVHGAGGNVLNFRDLSKHLGRAQPFFGLQAQGVDGRAPALETIEAMAELYLKDVERAWPSGPYLLGGYSGGGVVALEMARRLKKKGKDVARVVLFDTFCPGVGARRPSFKSRLERLADEGPLYFPRRARALLTRHVDHLSAELKVRFFESQGVPLPLELRDHVLTRQFYEAAERYRPSVYDGAVTLFRAREVAEVFAHAGPRLGWDRYLPRLEVHEIPGDHDSLVLEPNVQVLTERLRATLESSTARGAST